MMKSRHPSQRLFDELRPKIRSYPTGVTFVPKQIQGTSFFPGGVGLWVNTPGQLPPLPIGGTMILGHDFHSVAGYEASLKAGRESEISPTWRNLIDLLRRVQIDPKSCFFTNAYMGLREGATATGKFPGASDKDFKKRCQDFFLHQVTMQRPSLIVTLGSYVPSFLAPLSSQLKGLSSSKSFAARDSRKLSLIDNVSFNECEAPSCVVVSVTHPSLRGANVHRRSWGSMHGIDAEVAMVQAARQLANRKHHE